MTHSIKKRLAAGQVVRILAVGAIPNPKIIEIAGLRGGFHGVWIDEEHAGLTQREIEILALASRSVGLDSYVRIAPTNYAAVMRPMETGAGGVMAAQVRTVEEVRQIVRWAKFSPQGIRGLNLSNYEGGFTTAKASDFVVTANQDRWLSVQIETVEALDAAEAIAAIEGVDHLFVGPADLSLSLGVPGEFLHPHCVAALERVATAVAKAGKTWGLLVTSPDHANKARDLGAKLFAFASDLTLLQRGLNATQQMYADHFQES